VYENSKRLCLQDCPCHKYLGVHTALPEIPKAHDMILESKSSPNREDEHTEVEQHDCAHWANQTPYHRLVDRQPATAHKSHALSIYIQKISHIIKITYITITMVDLTSIITYMAQ
jgi:hypothetical protein